MATNYINTKIKLRYDSYSAWSSANPVLLKGEIALVEMPSKADNIQQVPTILMKVGDGTTNFSALKWLGAVAADVYDWAKASEKPVYAASEISGLSSYISGQIQDTDTQYKLVRENETTFHLESCPKGGSTWTKVGDSIELPKSTLVEGTANGTIKFNGTDVAVHGLGSAAYTASTAYATAEQGTKANEAKTWIDTNGAKVTGTAAGSITAAQTTANEAVAQANTNKTNIEALQSKVNTEKNVKEAIADALAAAEKYADDNDANATYAISYNNETKEIILTGSNGGATTKVDATAFIKDGMIDTVELNAEHDLVITFNTAAGKDPITIPLDEFIDVYTGSTGERVNVTVSGNKISADLSTAVQTSLGKADSAVQSVSVAGGTANGTIKLTVNGVSGSNVAITGLKGAAFVDTSAFDAAGTAQTKADAALESAKSYADGLAVNYDSKGSAAQALTDAKSYADGLAKNYDATGTAQNLINELDATKTAATGKFVGGITQVDGKITAIEERNVTTDDIIQGVNVLVFDCGSASGVTVVAEGQSF